MITVLFVLSIGIGLLMLAHLIEIRRALDGANRHLGSIAGTLLLMAPKPVYLTTGNLAWDRLVSGPPPTDPVEK